MRDEILYLCNRQFCEVCSNPTGDERLCNHTNNIYGAKNFKTIFRVSQPPMFVEVETKDEEENHA